MNENKKIYIKKMNSGCYSATLDCDDYRSLFSKSGFEITKELPEASIVLICTCIAGESAEIASFQELDEVFKSKSDSAQVVIGGCVTDIFREKLLSRYKCSIFAIDKIKSFAEYLGLKDAIEEDRLRDNLQMDVFNKKIKEWIVLWRIMDYARNLLTALFPRAGYMFMRFFNTTYAYSPRTYLIRCGIGCANRCSYCVIMQARGFVKSRTIQAILNEMSLALKKGYNHFLLVSDDLPSYGLDLGVKFSDLLKAIFALKEKFSLTLFNFNPMHILKDFDTFLEAVEPGRIKSIHYVLQSGSSRILSLMRRYYTKEEFIDSAARILKKDPSISLRTDIMVGFPGESEEDFAETLDTVRRVPFETINAYVFEQRIGTFSATVPDNCPQKVKRKRRKRILSTFHRVQLKRWIGCILKGEYFGHKIFKEN